MVTITNVWKLINKAEFSLLSWFKRKTSATQAIQHQEDAGEDSSYAASSEAPVSMSKVK